MQEPSLDFTEINMFIEKIALNRLEVLTGRQDLRIGLSDGITEHFSPLMAQILISGAKIRATFKVHFKLRAARSLAAPLYRVDDHQITPHQATDFIREYTNLVAGSLKKYLMDNGYPVGTSLPVVTRGFDKLFSTENPLLGSSSHWKLIAHPTDLLVSSLVEHLDAPSHLLKSTEEL